MELEVNELRISLNNQYFREITRYLNTKEDLGLRRSSDKRASQPFERIQSLIYDAYDRAKTRV